MDRTMTSQKIATERAAKDPRAPVAPGHEKTAKSKKPLDDIEITSLSIDDNDDFGGDPYNHTGSFYAPKFDD